MKKVADTWGNLVKLRERWWNLKKKADTWQSQCMSHMYEIQTYYFIRPKLIVRGLGFRTSSKSYSIFVLTVHLTSFFNCDICCDTQKAYPLLPSICTNKPFYKLNVVYETPYSCNHYFLNAYDTTLITESCAMVNNTLQIQVSKWF